MSLFAPARRSFALGVSAPSLRPPSTNSVLTGPTGIEYHFQYHAMILCICKGLSEHHVLEVVEAGARSVEAVGRACGAGTDCGTCQEEIEQVISACRLTESGRQLARLRAPSCP